jgi:hypothetical protein
MTDNVVPLFKPSPDLPLTYTAVLRGIAETIEQKCGLESADQVAEFGSVMTIVINIETKNFTVDY